MGLEAILANRIRSLRKELTELEEQAASLDSLKRSILGLDAPGPLAHKPVVPLVRSTTSSKKRAEYSRKYGDRAYEIMKALETREENAMTTDDVGTLVRLGDETHEQAVKRAGACLCALHRKGFVARVLKAHEHNRASFIYWSIKELPRKED